MVKSVKEILSDDFWIMPATPEYKTEGIPYITSKNIKNGSIDFRNVNYISEEDYESISKNRPIKNGDILISMIGTIGETAEVTEQDGKFYGQNMFLVRLNNETINKRYFLNYFQSGAVKRALEGSQNQSTQKYLKANHIEELRIPIPSIEEQAEIANRLDLLSLVITQRKKQLNALDELIKARFVEMFGNPVENPKGYRVDTLQDLIDAGDITYHLDGNHGGDYPRSEEFVSEGVPYIGANCISNGEIDFSLAKYLTVERAGKLRKGIAQNEDVLFAHNATVGPTVVLHTTEPKVILSTSLTAYRCNKESIMPEYLATYMKSDGFVMQYSSEMKQTTRNQVPITAQKKYLFLIPPMEEQKAFSEFVKQVDKSKVVEYISFRQMVLY